MTQPPQTPAQDSVGKIAEDIARAAADQIVHAHMSASPFKEERLARAQRLSDYAQRLRAIDASDRRDAERDAEAKGYRLIRAAVLAEGDLPDWLDEVLSGMADDIEDFDARVLGTESAAVLKAARAKEPKPKNNAFDTLPDDYETGDY